MRVCRCEGDRVAPSAASSLLPSLQSTPHRVILAKVRGYPLWPAKLISETSDKCDVRFFGQHDR